MPKRDPIRNLEVHVVLPEVRRFVAVVGDAPKARLVYELLCLSNPDAEGYDTTSRDGGPEPGDVVSVIAERGQMFVYFPTLQAAEIYLTHLAQFLALEDTGAFVFVGDSVTYQRPSIGKATEPAEQPHMEVSGLRQE